MLPQQIGPFRIDARVAVGGMGIVYQAHDSRGRPVAVKVMRPELAADAPLVAAFRREGEIGLRLPANDVLVRTLSVGDVEGRPWIALERLEGKDLAETIRKLRSLGTPVPAAVALHVAAQVCRGLAVLERAVDERGRPRPLLHRDVSPPNVFLDWGAKVKLVDLGSTQPEGEPAAAQVVHGRWAYASPEAVAGRPLDRRHSVFSTGALLFEMLTGLPAFEARTELETQANVARARVRPPSSFFPMPPGADAIVERALALEPERRFPSVRELEKALRAACAPHGDLRRALRELLETLFPDEAPVAHAS